MNIYTHPGNPENPKHVVILLHGYGADGQDLLGLADSWRDALPDTAFVSVDAPQACEMGFGYQWFSLKEWSQAAMATGALDASAKLRPVIAQVIKRYNIGAKDLAFVGFSQGTMMSLYTGLRLEEAPAGILGYSGALLSGDTLPQVTESQAKVPQICLIHGEADTVVPVVASIEASRHLKSLGYTVQIQTIPGLPHGIDQRGLQVGQAFLQQIFA